MRSLPLRIISARSVILFAALFSTCPTLFAQKEQPTPCDFAAADTLGDTFRTSSEEKKMHGDPAVIAEVQKRLDKVMAVFKETFPGPRGFQVEYNRTYTENHGSGPDGYSVDLMLDDHRCVHDSDPVTKGNLPTGHVKKNTAGNLSDGLNNDFRFHINATDQLMAGSMELMIYGRMHRTYLTKVVVGEWKGVTLYNGTTDLKAGFVLVGRPGEQPFIPVTQKQYAQGLIQSFQTGTAPNPVERERRQKGIAAMQEYLQQTPEATLNQPAWINAIGFWSGFHAPGVGGQQVVRLNPEYLHKNEPKYVPQFAVTGWTRPFSPNGIVAGIIIDRFMEKFPMEKLQGLFDQ